MHFFERYTPDLICRRLGLDGFSHVSAYKHWERGICILYLPSFHPEACINIFSTRNEARVSFTSFLGESLWETEDTVRIPSCQEMHSLTTAEFEDYWKATSPKAIPPQSTDRILDGVGCHFFVKRGGASTVFKTNISPASLARDAAQSTVELCGSKLVEKICSDTLESLALTFGVSTHNRRK